MAHTVPGHPYLNPANHASKGIARTPPLGTGQRFAALKSKLTGQKGVTNPGGLAAFIGRKKYGTAKMSKMATAGRKH